MLAQLRRAKVGFYALPDVGGASGGEYSLAQLNKVWSEMKIGHRYSRKKGDVRALILSADVFPPNIVKHGATASLADPIAVDKDRLLRVLDFMISKRGKEDLILLFDGRSRAARKIMEEKPRRNTIAQRFQVCKIRGGRMGRESK